jgi:hypothetical protein
MNICVHEHVSLYWDGVFSMYTNVFTKKSIYIYPLSRIYNTSLTSAYIGVNSCECEYVDHLFIFKLMLSLYIKFYAKMNSTKSCNTKNNSSKIVYLCMFTLCVYTHLLPRG